MAHDAENSELAKLPLSALREQVEQDLGRLRIERAANGPRSWTSWLPSRYVARAELMETDWLKEMVVELLKARDDEKQTSVTRLSDEQLSIFDKLVEEVRAKKSQLNEPEPKRLRTDNENLTTPSYGVSDAAASYFFQSVNRRLVVAQVAAVQVLWKMDFGEEWANPFRMRLTKEACDSIGMTDYYDVVHVPMDLSLIREKISAKAYPNDAALRGDIALIGANAARYHLPDSPIIDFANELLRTYDRNID